jgi:uncharacterized membrane protein
LPETKEAKKATGMAKEASTVRAAKMVLASETQALIVSVPDNY